MIVNPFTLSQSSDNTKYYLSSKYIRSYTYQSPFRLNVPNKTLVNVYQCGTGYGTSSSGSNININLLSSFYYDSSYGYRQNLSIVSSQLVFVTFYCNSSNAYIEAYSNDAYVSGYQYGLLISLTDLSNIVNVI